MAHASVAEAFTSFSMSRHSSSPGVNVKDANKYEYQQFQETELLEDTLVLDSPLVETRVETSNLDSELVECSDPVENLTTSSIRAYEQEVVFDSEDEETHDSKVVTGAKGLWDEKVDQAVKNPIIKFQKRRHEPPSPSKQAEERAAKTSAPCFGKSVTEIGELTQADALGYVDHYLSFNEMKLSEEICLRKSTREKSIPVVSARGVRNSARKIQLQTHREEKKPFEWVDSVQKDRGAGIFHRKIKTSSKFGVCGQTYIRRQRKSGYPENQGNCSTGNRCEEKLAQRPGTIAENNNSIKELDLQSDAARENVGAYSGVTQTEDISDIGLGTQIAAETMEALAYVLPPENRCTGIKDQPSNHRKRNNDVVEGGIVRHKRKRTSLVADPFMLVGEVDYLRLPSSSFGEATKCSLNCRVQVSPQLSTSSSFLRLSSWHYPKRPRGKRTCANVQRHQDAPIKWCTQSVIVNGKKSGTISNGSPKSQRGLEGQDYENASCLPRTHSLYNAKCTDTGTISEGKKVSNADFTCYKHHKRPSNKNLPKSSLLKELIRLGVPELAPDLGKDLRQRRELSHVRVLFSQHLDDSIIKQQKKILARMNISIASCSMEATHFVADKFTRTQNMLESMALGRLVVTHLWLESCGQANCFIDEKNYILRDVKKEREMGFSMPVSLARAKQQPLLKGKRVLITPHIKPDNKVITSLATAVHGQVVDECQIYAAMNDKILDDLLILSCEKDYAVCRPFLERGIAIYGSELLLSGIVTQKLELERYDKIHQLFANHVGRKYHSTYSRRFGKVYRRRRDLHMENS